MNGARPLSQSASAPADGLGPEGLPLMPGCPADFMGKAVDQHRTPSTAYHRIDPRQLQAAWDAEADRAAFRRLRTVMRLRGPDGVPLWAVILAAPAACFLAALCAAILPGA